MKNIKEKMQSGDVQGAADGLKNLLAAEPGNAEAQMLYGTCCHILGDDRTFGEIHDALAPKMAAETDERTLALWGRYRAAFVESRENALVCDMQYLRAGMALVRWLLVAGLVGVALLLFMAIWGKAIFGQAEVAMVAGTHATALYRGPQYSVTIRCEECQGTGLTSERRELCPSCVNGHGHMSDEANNQLYAGPGYDEPRKVINEH